MKINIVTKHPKDTLDKLVRLFATTSVYVDLIRVYPNVSADYDIQNIRGLCFSLDSLQELTEWFHPWDIRIY